MKYYSLIAFIIILTYVSEMIYYDQCVNSFQNYLWKKGSTFCRLLRKTSDIDLIGTFIIKKSLQYFIRYIT